MATTRKAAKKKTVGKKAAARKPSRKKATGRAAPRKAPAKKRAAAKPGGKVKKSGGLKRKVAGTVKAARKGLSELGEASGHMFERARGLVADAAETVKDTVASRL